MIRSVVLYGQEVLRHRTATVPKMSKDIRGLIADMLDTMRDEGGVGLAAPQIGCDKSVCVVDISSMPQEAELDESVLMPLIMINPRLTASEGETWEQEGCLSFPDIFVRIRRAESVDVEYKDMEWQDRVLCARGFLARAIQHETDHLNGVLLVDRMSAVQKAGVAGKLKRLKKRTGH